MTFSRGRYDYFAAFFFCAMALGCEKKPDLQTFSDTSSAPRRTPGAAYPGGDIPPPPVPVEPTLEPSPALMDVPPWEGPSPNWGVGADAASKKGVVTSVENAASHVGISVLDKGGNAIDAAVAVAFALSVTHPSAGNIGGGGFLMLKKGITVEAIDFREDSPSAMTAEAFWKMIQQGGRGPASVGVPGTVAGLHLAHQRHGVLPWAEVVAPAVRLAEEGYRLGARQAKTITWARAALKADAVARAAFFPTGKTPGPGTLIKRPRLALALRRIQEQGPPGFYEGKTAQDLVASLGDSGLLTLDDLKNYRAHVRKPFHFDFEKYRVITMPPPSAGGTAITQSLSMLEASNVGATKAGSSARYHLLAEVFRRAQVERQLFVAGPKRANAEADAQQRARALDPKTWLLAHPIDSNKATSSASLHPAFPVLDREHVHTTHLSVVDNEGNLASVTVTLSGSFGSHVFTQETGIVLNNSAASFSSTGQNTPLGGVRTTSSMAPTLVLRGPHALVLGSPGGDTIPATVTQTLLHLTLNGSSLVQAVNAPRLHQTFAPGTLMLERSRPLPAEIQAALRRKGHEISLSKVSIGDANIAAWVDGTAFAVCDRREGGLALGAPEEQVKAPPASKNAPPKEERKDTDVPPLAVPVVGD